ncbi:NAD(P)-dependent dehydrogenase (short-subunit alcohol dehydrogenase family) [Saccharothrix coeruleofusca]|uniref:SDR family oxidoreductase n=1 Tax=Saccharothrix coeruleofusca TaxID=33919 RepID=UPI001AE7CE60|nr:SDR family oxidoreductase [Saccharothrix coeruleofusca]MBP2336322.1 NAD(P)-dependent dehydrogenase (short-subunit alcohol dehydrogenase family) [Saccharothrix coeruleofusca]
MTTRGNDNGAANGAHSPLTVITGGSRGIGAATVRLLARRGHRLVFSYRTAAERARALADEVGAVAVRAEVGDDADVDRLFDTAAELGQVTGVVINAGITSPVGPLADTDPSDLRRVVEVNVVGALLCARRAARDLVEGGAIVSISSAAATLGSPGEYVHYAASKAAVDAMTIGLAKELGPRGIRVNAVASGTVDTEIHQLSRVPDRAHRVAPSIPLRRAGTAEEIAAAVAWLLGEEASFTTGAVLRVAGGL